MKKVISFDVWDTLIKRKCNPEEIKLFTMRYMLFKYEEKIIKEYRDSYVLLRERDNIEFEICKENEKNGKDGECRIIDVFNRLQEKVFINKEDSIAEELLRIEINHEKKMIYVNEDIFEIFEKYKDLKKYCISDFYMDEKSLKEILDSTSLKGKFEKIYSSADFLLNKKSGNLYKKFEEDLKLSPQNHIHVGDNEFSDIEMAKKLGIETIQMRKYGEYDFCPNRNRKFDFNLDSLKIKDASKREERLYNVGIDLAPLLYFFVNKIVEYGMRNNRSEIYYQTREGETFIKIHEMMKKDNIYEVKIPDCKLLEVSRVATFGASLNEITVSELLRLWSQYRCQSMKALFKTLDIDIKKYEPIIKKYEINIDEAIWEPWFNIKIQNLFSDDEFKNGINRELKEKRKQLIKFFESKGIVNDDKPMLVVDLGWRGTIQDNLAYIYTNKQIDGYYYALYDYYNVQPKNTTKFAFIKDKEITYEYIGKMITLFEMLFNPESGSVIYYKDNKAIRKVKESEYNTVKNITSHIQRGMLEGSKMINKYLEYHPFENSEFDNYIYDIIRKMKEQPSKELVEAYYSLVHNDTFGTGEYVDKRLKLTRMQKMNIFKCRDILRKEEWKEAFMIHNDIHTLKYILNFKSGIRKILGR